MTFPRMSHIYKSRDMTQVFKGYNHNLRIADGEFYDESGLTTDNYPVLSVRKAHVDTALTASKVHASYSLVTVSSDGVHYTNNSGQEIVADMGEVSQLVNFGNYILAFPSGKYVDLREGGRVGDISNKSYVYQCGAAFINFDVDEFDRDREFYGGFSSISTEERIRERVHFADEDPTSGSGGDLGKNTWYNQKTGTLFTYNDLDGVWDEVEGTYRFKKFVNVEYNGDIPFREMDYIRIYLYDHNAHGDEITIDFGSCVISEVYKYKNIDGKQGCFLFYETGEMNGTIYAAGVNAYAMFWQPNMDYYVEWNGRLWGCRYGQDKDGKLVNEIRCTAYRADNPSFREWERSYETDEANAAVFSLTSPGEFTGAAVFNGSLYFFKENTIHRVTGNDFTSFQVIDYTAPGVQAGSSDSVQVLYGALYYKGVEAVYRYDGSYPVSVSDEFANEPYKAATGGTKGHKYYLSMQSANKWSMMVYDAKLGIWHREGAIHATSFARVGNDLYYTDANSRVHCIGSEAGKTKVRWFAETGIIGLEDPDSKYYSQIAVRMNLPFGSSVAIDIQYDSCGKWETVKAFASTSAMRNVTLPVKLRRCDHLQMRFSGVGDCTIYSVTKTIEGGSDQ